MSENENTAGDILNFNGCLERLNEVYSPALEDAVGMHDNLYFYALSNKDAIKHEISAFNISNVEFYVERTQDYALHCEAPALIKAGKHLLATMYRRNTEINKKDVIHFGEIFLNEIDRYLEMYPKFRQTQISDMRREALLKAS